MNIIAIIQLVPAIIEAIKAVEAAIPGEGKGEQKLAAVRGILESVDNTLSSAWPQISGIVATLVKLFNSTGLFKK